MPEETVESLLKLYGKTAPRVKPEHLDEVIVGEEYIVSGLLTICILTLKNGFQVTGTSSCADKETFDKSIGEKVAKTNARDKIWDLEGYLLKERLYQAKLRESDNG